MSGKLKHKIREIKSVLQGNFFKANLAGNLDIAADRGKFNRVYFCHA